MNIQRTTLACAAALAVSMSGSHAGPCSPKITQLKQVIDDRIHAKASAALSARESTAAKLHRQPTPSSTSAAAGLTSPEQFKAVNSAMARARKADRAGNRSACEQALADVERLLSSGGTQTDDQR